MVLIIARSMAAADSAAVYHRVRPGDWFWIHPIASSGYIARCEDRGVTFSDVIRETQPTRLAA